MHNYRSLFTSRRFMPLCITQFLGAFNDNAFKNALIILILYQPDIVTSIDHTILVTVAAGLFILPYVLFSSIAGQLADSLEKSQLVTYIKWAELGIMSLAVIGFITANVWMLLAVLFAMGAQSTFFSPLKYSLLPDHLNKNALVPANAMFEATTFIAILTGTIAGGLLINIEYGVAIVSVMLLTLALIGIAASYFIPASGPFEPEMQRSYHIMRDTFQMVKQSAAHPHVLTLIIGISWFWFVGATYLSQFPAYTREVLNGSEAVVTTLLAMFTIGIAIGAYVSHYMLKGQASLKYVPFALIGMTIFTWDMCYVSLYLIHHPEPITLATFLTQWHTVRILFDLCVIAACGGVYIVPLNALLQIHAPRTQRARVMAANNVMNALGMVSSSIVIIALLSYPVSIPHIFFVVGVMNIVVLIGYKIDAL